MRRFVYEIIVCVLTVTALSAAAMAQARGGTDWMTDNGDAQRSAWIRSDSKISRDGMLQKPGGEKPAFQFLWKLKLKNAPRGLNSLTPPSTLERLIGYRGFRMLGFVGGSSDNIITIDTDLGRLEWEKRLTSGASSAAGSLACPGGMTTGVTRPTLAIIPPSPTGGGGFGRSNPARSAVGAPSAGAVTLAQVRPSPSGPPPSQQPAPARINPANPPGGQFGAGPFLVYALSSDGMFHSLHLSNGADYEPPVKFLPPNSNAAGLVVIDNVAYVTTSNGCGGTANGVWALDLVTKQVAAWKSNVAGSAGPAFGGDGTIFVATGAGGESPNSVVALDPKTLKVKDSYSAGDQEFTSTPVVFDLNGRTLVAATTKDGRLHLLAGSNLGGSDHKTALSAAQIVPKPEGFAPGALASWQEPGGTRWILAPAANAVVAWKVVEQGGSLTLQAGWTSRDLVSPLAPTIINGVVFVTSSGEYRTNDAKMTAAQRIRRSSPAVIYALDGLTGKELWNSGSTITSFTRGGALSGGVGQIYLGTHDGALYAFGFPMEH